MLELVLPDAYVVRPWVRFDPQSQVHRSVFIRSAIAELPGALDVVNNSSNW
jgi:hypothetical protein